MKLNWFSPLSPAKTDIADYTLRVLPELSKYAEIVLWTDRTNWDRELEQYARVKHYQLNYLPWSKINNADLNIYHIGNNAEFHSVIWSISRICSGIIVLHDFKLHELFGAIYREHRKDKNSYLQQMVRYYGGECKQIAEDFWTGKLSTEFMAEHYPLTNLAIDGAIGVITHNREAYQILTKDNCSLIGYTPLPYASQSHLKPNHSPNSPPYKLIVFGYINYNRRLDTILEALASLPEKNQFYLDIYGEIWDRNYIQRKIEYLQLQKLVKIHGFVRENVLNSALANAHLAINLRYPTMGEASGSQLRIWNHALPSLVTKIGWYSTLPEDAVAFVYPESEIEDIQQQLRNFLCQTEKFFTMGKKGKELLEKYHTPKIYARAIFEFAEKAIQYRGYPLAGYLVRKVSEETNNLETYHFSKEQIKNSAEAISYLVQ
ncbi:glycosyltransferase [Myxosarcina sp. GI1(2024)]